MSDPTRRTHADNDPLGEEHEPDMPADLSDRRRAEAAILESRRLYEDLVSSVPLGVYRVEPTDGGFRFVFVNVFAAHADDIACVILDLSMPQMDGVSVFRALRAIRPDVRVILSSGYSRHHEPGMDLAAEGLAGFIQKPYAAKTLRDEVARVVAGLPER